MSDQLNLFEMLEAESEKERSFKEKTDRYNRWLALPDEILIKEGSEERENLSGILWGNYRELYGMARHECERIPENQYIWMNPCECNYWVLHTEGEICGEHIEKCPYCGAELGKGKGDAYLYKAEAKHWLFYLHYDVPMHNLGYQPKEDRSAIKKVWG
jgi:ribosomal protein L24E